MSRVAPIERPEPSGSLPENVDDETEYEEDDSCLQMFALRRPPQHSP